MDTRSFALQALEALSPVLLAILAWIGAKLAALIQAKVKNEYLRGALSRLDDAVFNAVRAVEQSVVSEIRKANEDGVITPEERAQIKAAAIAAVKGQLGLKGLGELAKVLGIGAGAVDSFLGDRIEAAVGTLKGPQ